MQKPTRIMERSSSMRKRTLEQQQGDGDGGQPEEKRPKVPALASVIVEALKVDSLQKLCSSLEPILRRVVSEEVERALAKLGPARISGRTSPKRIEGPDGRNLQLRFRSSLSLPLFTGGKVEGEAGSAVHVVLLDASTDQVVTSGLEACAKLDVVVLEGDFNNEDEEGWTQEHFESHVVKEREGKRPLLTGELQVNLKEGVGTLGDFTFTDNSSWIRSRKFRLGLKVSSGYCEGIRIREAKTDAFTVKDHRGELYKKHYPPALHDEVWRLEKIGKDGSFHKRLNKAGIFSVEDFLRLVVRDPQRLRTILGSGMSNKMWDAAVEHAKTCLLSGKLYIYYGDDSRTVGVIFNNIYELSGLVAGDQYYSAEALSDSQKVYVDALVKKAYENWPHVVEYDGKALLSFKQNKKMASAKGSSQANQITSYQAFDQEVAMQRMPMAVTSDLISDNSVHGGATSSGYTDNSTIHYSANPQQLVPNSQIQFDTSAYVSQEQVMNSQHAHATHSNTMGLELGAAQTSTSSFPSVGTSMQPGTINSHDDWSRHREQEFFTEEEIRMRSSEMLENEDMQQLLRLFSMGGGGMNMTDDAFAYSSYIPAPSPTFAFGEDRSRSSGRAVVGWLKLKAALRWGIFIRKIAAEKRAQLVELEDS